MARCSTLLKFLLQVNSLCVCSFESRKSHNGVLSLHIHVRPHKHLEYRCPHCHKRCCSHGFQSTEPRCWRALDFNGVLVYLYYRLPRIFCPEHGVQTADVPWAFPGSRFTKNFDFQIAWMAKHLSRSAVAVQMRIDWKTVGRCVTRASTALDPSPDRRLNGLVNIGIDETSYRKGHKYITVVVNHDTNCVVWAADGHGTAVLSRFFEQLSDQQRRSIKIGTADTNILVVATFNNTNA